MNMIKKISLVISFCISFVAFSQLVTKKDTLDGTPLSVQMEPKINAVLEHAEKECLTEGLKKNTNSGVSNTTSETRPKISVTSKPLTDAEICRQNPKLMGFKIQVAVVKSNEEAKEVGLSFRKKFPSLKVQVDASLRPNYKILAGSYFRKEGAQSDLRKVREYFKEAMVIQYSIFCTDAK